MIVLSYAILLLLLVAVSGGLAYYALAVFAVVAKHQRDGGAGFQPAPPIERASMEQVGNLLHHQAQPGISLLKPLRGADTNLAQCLETFFQQDYPTFEILFAVRQPTDPGVAVVRELMARHPSVAAQLLFTDEPPYANAKVFSMEKMANAAQHDLLVITDSDTSVARDYLRDVTRHFADAQVGVLTHLYRGVPGTDLWSRLEAIGMSTEFMAGVVVAERLEGMKFALGPSMAVRRACLRDIGGFAAMADYLADDFVLGHWAEQKGWRVALSCNAINHHATATGFWASFVHRLRWNRSTRYSRPAGYVGQGFTYGLSWALLLALAFPAWWSFGLLVIALTLRCVLAWQLSKLLGDENVLASLWLLPLQDVLSFSSWLGGFAGREIVWRNERYRLLRDGRFEPIKKRVHGVQPSG
jgi:ceramide glucosyltransferase